MKQVEFEHVTSELCGWGLGKGNRYEFAGVEEIITRRVQEGWTFYCITAKIIVPGQPTAAQPNTAHNRSADGVGTPARNGGPSD